ncbi:URC4/urg3 family protein [Xylophilus sp. GOD-11R]|uniref:URC4/urg3 family protein n=1 Tax=Xylophilus sp. GOD-11R TaxID=3089814 RepID=UPI00298BF9FF|nr:URC4/urg3 family protein [Xylophilus sp. GOD-11R]WPB55226.1 URC4/urg3 family protein [Xylophilus sp. GOD-11R]
MNTESNDRIIERIDLTATTRPDGAAALLRSTPEIRRRAQALLARARAGESEHFTVDDSALATAAGLVAATTRERYPKFAEAGLPFHSRWRHFEAGGVDRRARLDKLLGPVGQAERARAQIDLALVSVLLDAGAGPGWRYAESASGQEFSRSEGLGVASFHAFTAGLFSSDPARPLQVDAAGLRGLVTDHLAQAFQVGPKNPLVGIDGRATLLRRLGEVLASQPETYGEACRPAGMFDLLTETEQHEIPPTAEVGAHDILSTLLSTLSPIWPSANAIGGEPLGDCWRLRSATGPGLTDGWMPFHKLSQWLTYSLIEPFQWAGVPVRDIDALTGLPEYRNGGLLLDGGVLLLRDAGAAVRTHAVGDPLVVEWRALTVALLDELAPLVRTELGTTAETMPLACILEGGSWAAGRVLAQRLRGGTPPLVIDSDGTVF